MHLQPFGQLPNYRNGRTALPSLRVSHSAIPDRAGNVDYPVPIVLPQKPLNLALPQPHERSHGEGSRSWFGKQADDGLQILQAVGIQFVAHWLQDQSQYRG